MEKERKITAPDGCEIEKVELVDGVAVVTFREKERKLPKSWEEFCKMFPIKDGEAFINQSSLIVEFNDGCVAERNIDTDKNVLPNSSTAEAVLALCQLIQLRNCYNGYFVPDWDADDGGRIIYVIDFVGGKIHPTSYYANSCVLHFKTEELRDEFLRNFRPLIEKLKPLYGIKEGGEQ